MDHREPRVSSFIRSIGLAIVIVAATQTPAQTLMQARPLPIGPVNAFPDLASYGFEDPSVDGTPAFIYYGALTPPANQWQLWTMTSGAGIALNGSGFTSQNPPAPQGTRVGFIQGAGSTISTSYAFQPGTWRLRVKGAQRKQVTGVNHQVLRVTVGGVEYAEWDFKDDTYQVYVTRPFTIDVAVTLPVVITGLNPFGGDNTSLIDDVRLASIPTWDNPATWGGSVPTAMDMVTIPAGVKVALKGLGNQAMMVDVQGELLVTDRDSSLSTESLMVMGDGALFECGRPETPFEQKFTLTLVGTYTTAQTKFLMAHDGGAIELHGSPRKSWTRLNATALAGAGTTTITLADPVDWQPGDQFVIAGSTYQPVTALSTTVNFQNHAEVMKVSSVSGSVVTLDQTFATLQYDHFGGAPQVYSNPQATQTWTLDQRAEVGLLTHNVKVEGDANSENDPLNRFGGHIMIMGPMMGDAAGSGRLSNVELHKMGQNQILGRYPMHWHMMLGDAVGQYIKNCSVHRTYNRAITVHGTEHVTVEGNVVYENEGHAIFLEDGSERFNVIKNNLALYTIKPAPGEEMLPSDNQLDELQNRTPAAFWITNPNNTITGNAAAGSRGTGFWFIFPASPTGLSSTEPYFTNQNIQPYKEALGTFDGNSCHDCGSGFDVNDSIYFHDAGFPDHSIETNISWDPPGTGPVYLTNFTAYGCDVGIYAGIGGDQVYFDRAVLSDNREDIRLAAYHTVLNSVAIAKTANVGFNNQAAGYVVYDGAGRVKDSHFVDFNLTGNPVIRMGGGATMHPNHLWSGVTYSQAAFPRVSAENYAAAVDPFGNPVTPCSANDAQNNADPRKWGSVVRDLDGTLWGTAGSSLIGNHPMTYIAAADITPATVPATLAKLSPFRFGHLRINHPNYALANLPDVIFKRDQNGIYPSAQFTNCFKIDLHKQCPIIVGSGFTYTLTWPVLPTTKIVKATIDDVATTDSAVVKLAGIGAQPGLVVTGSPAPTQQTSLANLLAATTTSYYVETATGILWVKFANVNKTYTVTITWT